MNSTMIKKVVFSSLMLFVGLSVTMPNSAIADPNSPVGEWKQIDDETGKAKSIIKIWEKDGKLFGKIIKLFREPHEDQNPLCEECKGNLHNKPVLGMTILRNLVKDDDEWSGGTIMDPNNGETYKCYIELQDGGAKLKVRGYIGISLLGRTQYWFRIK